MRRRRVGMWTLGLTLVIAGGALLYRELTGSSIDVGRYWPLVIVGLGVELLIAQSRADYAAGDTVRVSPLAIIGLILVLTAAPLAGGPWGISCWPVGQSCNGTRSANQEHRIDRGAIGLDWAGVTALEVDVTYGTVEVRAVSGTDGPSARLEVVGHGFTAASAKAIAERAELRPERDGGRLVLRGFNETAGNSSEYADLNLVIRVPADAAVTVNDEFGPVTVEGPAAAVRVVTRYATAAVAGVTGNVSVESEHGRCDVSRIVGDAAVKTTYGRVTVADVTGRTEIDAKHGSVDVSDIGGDLALRATYGRVNVTNVAGDVDIASAHGAVDLRYAAGDVTVDATYGGITVRYNKPPAGDCALENTYGGISLEFPRESAVDLDVASQRTRITSNVPGGQVTVVGSGSALNLDYNGGGTKVDVRNDFGRIELRVF